MIPFASRAAVLALVVLGWAGAAAAEPTRAAPATEPDTSNGVAPVKPAGPAATATQAAPPPAAQSGATASAVSEAQRYCQNIAAAAADARYVWQTRRLADLQGQVTEKITALEAKNEELKALLARRDDALKRASGALVGIYAKMKPDTAAAQIAALDDETAAAMLEQLNPRASSAILDEMKPDRAARLVNTMVGVVPPDEKKS